MIVEGSEYYEALGASCDEAWRSLADGLFTTVPNFIVQQFKDFVNNPLCLGITSILLTVAGFIFLRSLIASVSR